MFTQEEKKILLDLLNSVQVTGNRQTIGKTLEKLDALARKIEAMPAVTASGVGAEVDPVSPRSAVPPGAAVPAGQHRQKRR